MLLTRLGSSHLKCIMAAKEPFLLLLLLAAWIGGGLKEGWTVAFPSKNAKFFFRHHNWKG
jgi:hypothetical protein